MLTDSPAAKLIPDAKQKPIVYTCISCRVKFDTTEKQRTHFKSDWHQYNLKRKVCNLPAIDLPSFQEIADQRPSEKDIPEPTRKQIPGTSKDQTGSDTEDIEEEEWDDYDEEVEEAEMLARVIDDDTCLFCNKKSSNIHKNIEHMNLYHGFFIPEEQYLIDLEGLMEYLGFKVGAGATCLWCSKEFTTTNGARLHMMYKDHCRIFYNQDKALDEFKEFYDYSTQEHIPMKPLNQLVISKRATRRGEYGRALVKPASVGSRADISALIKKSGPVIQGKIMARKYKKFDAVKAKTMLKIGMGNNNTMRSRIRLQNPM